MQSVEDGGGLGGEVKAVGEGVARIAVAPGVACDAPEGEAVEIFSEEHGEFGGICGGVEGDADGVAVFGGLFHFDMDVELLGQAAGVEDDGFVGADSYLEEGIVDGWAEVHGVPLCGRGAISGPRRGGRREWKGKSKLGWAKMPCEGR
jgi:hypothetical protein